MTEEIKKAEQTEEQAEEAKESNELTDEELNEAAGGIWGVLDPGRILI